jgi:serine protease
MLRSPSLAWALVGLVLVGEVSVAQDAPQRMRLPSCVDTLPDDAVQPGLLALKLAAGCEPVVEDGVLRSRSGLDLATVRELCAEAVVRPMVTCVDRELLDSWHAQAVQKAVAAGHAAPGHPAHWFLVTCPEPSAAAGLAAELRAQPLVEFCYREPRLSLASPGPLPDPTDPPPTTPDFRSMQQYLGPAPTGLDLRWANGILGGRGEGVKIRVVEEDWLSYHEDIAKMNPANLLGSPGTGVLYNQNHGVSGASLLVGDRNCFGVDGAVDEADIRFIAFPTNGGIGNALIQAAVSADPGDVLMMILQLHYQQLGPDDWVPIELIPAVYDFVVTVTGSGRVLVATLANGGRSLDDPRFQGAFDRTIRDSGAIFGGASENSTLQSWSGCNFGAIADASAWGTNVTTAGHGTLFHPNNDHAQAYAHNYQGTSAGVPLVTAAVVALQGAARWQLGRDFSTAELRQLLHTHHTAISGQVGGRPDLRALFVATGILDGLELSAPDTTIGTPVAATVSDNAGGGALLFASLSTSVTPLGYNRPVHLDLASLSTMDFALLGGGQAQFTIQVPNNTALTGTELFLQSAVLRPNGVHITNSCHLTVL